MIKSNPSARTAAIACTAFTAVIFLLMMYFRVSNGVCPVLEPLESFDVERYTGVWH